MQVCVGARSRVANTPSSCFCCNGAPLALLRLLLPQAKSDEMALEIIQKAYPDRKVVGVYSREVLLNAGNVHCITQQWVAPK
jgi:agmatine deiminase